MGPPKYKSVSRGSSSVHVDLLELQQKAPSFNISMWGTPTNRKRRDAGQTIDREFLMASCLLWESHCPGISVDVYRLQMSRIGE